jgi:hypothetical protein
MFMWQPSQRTPGRPSGAHLRAMSAHHMDFRVGPTCAEELLTKNILAGMRLRGSNLRPAPWK